jgi:hypothetical protein
LIDASEATEGTVEKARTVISSTWDLLEQPEAVVSKLSKAAAKINGPKRSVERPIYDISYLFQYCFNADTDFVSSLATDLSAISEHCITLFKGYTGWRSDDLAGVFREHGLIKTTEHGKDGYSIRSFSNKNRQNEWSNEVFIPRLHNDFASVCLCTAIDAMIRAQAQFTACAPVSIPAPPGSSGSVQATPLFCFRKSRQQPTLLPLKAPTIGKYFQRYFLDNVTQDGLSLVKNGYSAHSNRHAVASKLRDMQVPVSTISRLTGNATATLEKSYYRAISREWEIPQACCDNEKFLSIKLLLPFVHHHSSNNNSDCACASIFSSATD